MKERPTLGRMRVGIIQFPGSNCDDDCVDALERHFGVQAPKIWYQEANLPKLDGILLPGGFSFGDYLRSGALAARSPIIESIKSFAKKGGPILGICNGFQVLTESGLLPGALLQNQSLKFVCKMTTLRDRGGQILHMPIAHAEGRYWIDEVGLKRLEDQDLIAYRYSSDTGTTGFSENPNGSVANIAGILSWNGRILGLMPHPERATDKLIGGSCDGLKVLREFIDRI